MIKLVLADMDSTLVPNSVAAASERTLAAIDRLRASGIGFGCATGRAIANTISQFRHHPEYVTEGIYGAGKQVLVHGELIRDDPFPPDLMARIAAEIARLDYAILVPFIYGADPEHPFESVPCSIGENPEKIQRALDYYNVPGRNGNLWDNWQYFDGMPSVDIYSVGVLSTCGQEEVPRIIEFFEQRFPEANVKNAAMGWCDVNVGKTTKATPFPEYLAACGCALDEIVFLADSENDLELMKLIPNSICVANAMPEAAAHAYAMIPADVDDGPAQLMEALAENGGDLDAALNSIA